jgi:two-component system sensor histidine kinase RegB
MLASPFLVQDLTKIRLRTLIVLRWVAILGQIAAIAAAQVYFDFTLPVAACLAAVGASIAVNLGAVLAFPESKRITDTEAMAYLTFDVVQLSFLLFLTGGLTNPFALLIIAPVIISASALRIGITVTLGLIAIALVSLVGLFNLPLRFDDGQRLDVPFLFEFGFWLSIVTGILFLGLYAYRVATEIKSMSDALLATQMALAREQKLTDLGGVVAAAAHELGTPLATIKLASAELMTELTKQPELYDDAKLIHDQANRCRDILRSMGRAGKDDPHLHNTPLEALLREAAEPHTGRGKTLRFDLRAGLGGTAGQPVVTRKPEVIHGLRNLIQNAVDFAQSTVWIEAEWTRSTILVRISDDGDGYPPQLLGRIGDPFMRWPRADSLLRRSPAYEGMGLGLFIAKTLLERSGAQLTFGNGPVASALHPEASLKCGAMVELIWPAKAISAPQDGTLGKNTPYLP